MSDPRRMRDDSDASALLRAARPSRPMTRDERGRGASRVAKLASAPLAGSAILLWMKLVAAAASIGVASAVAIEIAAPTPPPPPAPTAITKPTPARPPQPTPLPDPAPPPAEPAPLPLALPVPVPVPVPVPALRNPPAAPTPQADPPPPPAPPPIDALTREAQLIESARHSLPTDPTTTLQHLEAHQRAFPQGQLADERELIAVDALRRLGRTTEARARGEALLRRDPSGLYSERTRSILATLP